MSNSSRGVVGATLRGQPVPRDNGVGWLFVLNKIFRRKTPNCYLSDEQQEKKKVLQTGFAYYFLLSDEQYCREASH